MGTLLNYGVIIILAAMIGVGGFFAGKYAGVAQCEAAHLRQVIKAADDDASTHSTWEDENVDAALSNSNREERNAKVVKKLVEDSQRNGGDMPCVRARFLHGLSRIE